VLYGRRPTRFPFGYFGVARRPVTNARNELSRVGLQARRRWFLVLLRTTAAIRGVSVRPSARAALAASGRSASFSASEVGDGRGHPRPSSARAGLRWFERPNCGLQFRSVSWPRSRGRITFRCSRRSAPHRPGVFEASDAAAIESAMTRCQRHTFSGRLFAPLAAERRC